MSKQNIHIEQDHIDELQRTVECVALFERVLGRLPSDCLLTDLSELSDFLGAGMPKQLYREGWTYEQYCDAWDQWVLQRIKEEFGLELPSTRITLIRLVHQLQQAGRPPTLN